MLKLTKIDLANIVVDENVLPNPRQNWQDDLEELSKSIAKNGLLHPISVAAVGGKYIVFVGFRRFGAIKLIPEKAQKKLWPDGKIGVSVLTGETEEETLKAAQVLNMVENLQREDLKPYQVANGFKKLSELGLTQAQIATRLGMTQGYVSQLLSIVDKLDNSLWAEFCAGTLTVQDALKFTKLTPEQQKGLLETANEVDDSEVDAEVEGTVQKQKSKQKKLRDALPPGTTNRVKYVLGAKGAQEMLSSVEQFGVTPDKSQDYKQGMIDTLRFLLGIAELPVAYATKADEPKKKRGRPKKKAETIDLGEESAAEELDLGDDE